MPREIIDEVYSITYLKLDDGVRYQSYFINADVPTLIDTAYPAQEEEFMADLRDIDIEPERFIITHADRDHIGCFDTVVREYDVESWVPVQSKIETEFEPDHRFDDGDDIGPFKAIFLPGHSPDNYALHYADRDILVAGDSALGSDFRGLPPGYLTSPPAMISDDLSQAENSLYRLLDYDFEVALVGHGESVLEGARDKLAGFLNIPLPEDTKERLGLDY